MFTLPNFCRVCLKYDKHLIDLAHIDNEPNETLISKLQLCVSEVEWNAFKPLLCHPCIKRLNIAYSFKKQCVQSAGVLKNYVDLVKESQKKNESQGAATSENPLVQGSAYMLLPNQKYVKILVGSQNQGTTGNTNSFQNVFLNLIPTTTISPVPTSTAETNIQKTKDTNQNVFLNLNNTFQKFIPVNTVDPPPLRKNNVGGRKSQESLLKANLNLNVNQLLTEYKSEEMSVEIDPTSFLSLEHDESSSNEDDSKNDWDEVITQQKVESKKSRINGTSPSSLNKQNNGKDVGQGNYVPILPKDDLYSGGHFLSTSARHSDINCESCQKTFPTIRLLKQHLKYYHLGKLPFKCEYCYLEHLVRADYENCISRHKKDQEVQNTSLTLKDFTGDAPFENDALSISNIIDTPADINLEPNENGDYACDVCNRIFNSSPGLLRHRVRKHNQTNRKKYFVKGKKNAKCDICKRDFSTQSYMQLHRKLHMRDDGGYKYKVQGRSKYKDVAEEDQTEKINVTNGEDINRVIKNEPIDVKGESIDVTPDISMYQEEEESETESESEQQAKKIKVDDEGMSDSHEVKGEDGGSSTSSSTSSNEHMKKEPDSESSGSEDSDSSSDNEKN